MLSREVMPQTLKEAEVASVRRGSVASTSGYQPLTPAAIKQKARDLNAQGLSANKAGDTKVALSCFERANELDPDEPLYLLSAANMHFKIEQLEQQEGVRMCRKSTGLYLKVLESPELPPRLAVKAQSKLQEARALTDLW